MPEFRSANPNEFERIADEVINQYVQTDNQFEKENGYDTFDNPVIQEALKYQDNQGRSADDYITHEIQHNLVIRDWGENYNFDPKKFMESFLQTGGPDLFVSIAESQPEFMEQWAMAVNEGNDTQSGFLSESFLENVFTPSFRSFEDQKRKHIDFWRLYAKTR